MASEPTRQDALALAGRAISLTIVGLYEPALQLLTEAITMDDSVYWFYMRRGLLHSVLGHMTEAFDDLHRAVELDKQESEPLLQRA